MNEILRLLSEIPGEILLGVCFWVLTVALSGIYLMAECRPRIAFAAALLIGALIIYIGYQIGLGGVIGGFLALLVASAVVAVLMSPAVLLASCLLAFLKMLEHSKAFAVGLGTLAIGGIALVLVGLSLKSEGAIGIGAIVIVFVGYIFLRASFPD